MLRKRDIRVGKCYVNNTRTIVRQVVQVNNQIILFNTYHLDTGYSCGSPSECLTQDFTHWVDCEASPTELARLQ